MGKGLSNELVKASPKALGRPLLELLQAIPEEQLWLEGQRSPNTRTAYRNDVAGFMALLGISTTDELRQINRAAVIAFRRQLEELGAKPTTIRRKLSALSSLFAHLVDRQVLSTNLCREVQRPRVNRREGRTPAFSKEEARKILDAPDQSLRGLRDRALLSVGFQAGPRRSAIVKLKVKDFYRERGYSALRFVWKGGHEHALALHPQTAQRIQEYLKAAGHGEDLEGPLFRRVLRGESVRRHLGSETVSHVLFKYIKQAGVKGRYSAHSMRATFITTALENGASLEEVQRAAGHANADTTKLYDKRGDSPDKSAAFFASY